MKRKLPKKLLSLLLSGILMVTSLETSTVYAAEESVSQESITDSIDPESETEITTDRPQEETTSPETQTETDIASAEQPTENVSSEHEEEHTSSEQSTEKSSSELPAETVSSETEQENDTLIEESATEAIQETVTSSLEDETEETTEEIKTVETSKTQSVIVVNPLYEGIIDPDDLAAEFNSQEDSINPLSGEDAASFQTFEDAAKYLREQMVARVGTVSIQVPTSVSTENGGENGFPKTLLAAAMAHTEECSGEEGDALAWQYGGSQMSISHDSNTYTTTYTISYYTTHQQEQELTAKVNEALDNLALSDKTDYQKVKAIHDYICDNVDYDYDNLNNDAYKVKFTAYGALCTGKAVCQGYAVLFYRMCKEAGLSVKVITGTGNGGAHAWNIVKIGNNTRAAGKYYNIDCTWDGQDAETYHTYFLLNEADFKDHIRNDEYDTAEFHAQYPMAETSYIDESAFESGLNTDNPDVTFTTLDDTTVSSAADGKPKLLVFFRTTCGNSQSTIKAIAGNNFSGVDIYAAEIDGTTKNDVISFKNTYGSDDIIFSYDTAGKNSTSLFRYAEAGGLTDGNSMSVALPVLCYIDTNNKLQYVTQGLQNASEIKANLDHYCGAPSIVQYKITYVLDGGNNNSSNPSTYEDTTDTIILKDPTKTGYTFAGWYLDAAFTQKITQIDKGTSGDITLYAKWTANAAADKLNLDNLDIEFTNLDDNYISSKADGKPKLIIFFSHNCSNSQRTIQGIRQGIQNVDIFAIETIGGSKADVLNFKNTYGSDAIVFSYDNYGYENNRYLNDYVDLANHNSITPPTICYIDADNKLQHITNGYRSASDIKTDIDRYCGTSSEPSPAETYTITYVLDGGINNTSNPTTYTTRTETITLQNPTREGYIFDGWYRDAFFTQAITRIEKGSSGNLTIYAKWKTQDPEKPDDPNKPGTPEDPENPDDPNKPGTPEDPENPDNPVTAEYTVTFNTQGHGTAPQPITNIKSGDRITKPADPSAAGYRFDGWYQDASCQKAWNFSTDTVQANITLYAKWVQTADENGNENDNDYSRYPSDQRKSLKSVNAAIANIQSKVYDGNPYKPAVKVTANDGGRQITLAESTDYKVLYENNVNAGTGKVIVRGIGTYSGEITKEFNITRKPIKKLNIVTGGMAANAASDLPVYVYDGTRLLQEGTDYTLSNLTDVKSTSAKVTVTAGKNSNYDGSVTAKITLYTADADKIINPDNVTLSANSASYTGKAVTSIVPTVKIGNETLEKNKHYKVQYKNNTKAGTALVIITGKGQYKGKVVKSFTITASKSKLTVRGISDKTYNGKLQKPTVTVLDGTKKLKVNKDYTVTYEKNLLAGKTASDKAIVKITGIGNYEGAYTETTFTIQPQKMSKASFKADKKSGITLTYNKKLLTEGIDYTLTYGETKKGKVQVKITGINDFTGEMTKSVKENIISANS